MLSFNIPGRGDYAFEYIVLDYNGTLATDGRCDARVKDLLRSLAGSLRVFVLTADTYGTVTGECADLPVEVTVVDPLDGGSDKLALVKRLGPEHTIAVGNGYNDAKMLGAAALSIVVLGREGAAGAAMAQADVVVSTPEDALSLILNAKRLVATLRR